MYCGQCASQLADHHRFCTSCGHSADVPAIPDAAVPTPQRFTSDANALSAHDSRAYLPGMTSSNSAFAWIDRLQGLSTEPAPTWRSDRETEHAIRADGSLDSSNPLDPAVLAFDDGLFDEALTLLQRVGSVAEASDDELQLTQTLEVLDQMIQHLDDQERQPFEALAESTERRIQRMRDAALPPRLA